jgi:SAM-dependent methyltransferase
MQETRAFFGPRAATWDERFPDDGPLFASAVGHLGLRPGGVVVDVGCGTGRALPHLRRAVGSSGLAVGVDATPEMCAVAAGRGTAVLGEATRLPFATGACHAVFAAGLLNHLPDPSVGLTEFARVTRTGGALVLFHPIGRAALAARRGHELDAGDVRDARQLPAALEATGWELTELDDAVERYLAVAVRR